jgi:hypothetical protein
MTAIVRGKSGLARLLASLTNLRVLVRPEALLVLLAPTGAALVLAGFSVTNEAFLPGLLTAPDKPALLAMGIGVGIIVGILEETGWTGFATAELLTRRGVVKVGLLVGSIHGVWHLAAGYWSEGPSYGAYYIPYFLVAWIAGLTVLRLLVVWLYNRTGSLLLAALTHAGYTGGLLILWPTNALPVQTIAWTGCFVLLFAMPVVVLMRRGQSGGASAAPSPRQPK